MTGLSLVDWLIIVAFLAIITLIGLYFTRKGSADLDSYFISGRTLPWYIAGSSIIATSFAADTPLWVTNLVRTQGIHYLWQYWAPFIGVSLGAVYFGRMWRRMGFLTDVQLMEARYTGRAAGLLRGISGGMGALFFCPLIISWVVKAMETISRETLGLPEEYRAYTTAAVVLVALCLCATSGLYGVVYTDFLQFIFATLGTALLAIFAVEAVGGLGPMREQLHALGDWGGNGLDMLPSVGSGAGSMSAWNAIGMFCLLWVGTATNGGYNAQRLLACRSSTDAAYAQILSAVVYYALLAWPWILVALCSMILLPVVEGDQAAAYPKMLALLMPTGLRGLLVAALLAAFVSTLSTLFNWGSSYLVNDVFRRFVIPGRPDRTYLMCARAATVVIALAGATIAFFAKDIQTLLTISYVAGSGGAVLAILRWLWWRLNSVGDLVAFVAGWTVMPLLLFAKIFDAPARIVLGLEPEVQFSSDPDLVGARMLFMWIVVGGSAVLASLVTKPESPEVLREFLLRARPFRWGWLPVVRSVGVPYEEYEGLGRTLLSWGICAGGVGALLFAMGELLLGSAALGATGIAIFAVALWITVRRMKADGAHEQQIQAQRPHDT